MEEAATVSRAVSDAVHDVVPDALREDITTFVEEGSPLPGVLTLVTADLFGGPDADFETVDGLVERGVGVQLIYDGLRLTRDLVHDDPWAAGEKAAADMDILAADVMVARGFYLLARTEAAEAAVEVVRAFGRDQTDRRERDDPAFDGELERDVLELAVLAGASAVGSEAPDASGFASRLLDGHEELPDPDGVLTDGVRADLLTLADGGSSTSRAVRND
jgi:hypothetical protein